MTVEVVSPEKVLYSGEATMVTCRTVGGGDIAFLTGHVSFIGALATWPVKVVTEGADVLIAVHGGFVEVSNDKVTILSDVAELAEQIEVPRAERALERAETARRDDGDDEEAAAAVARAQVRLQVAGSAALGAGSRH
ncbi:MAG: ATP synthase F1 subunit epsilon [Acidimicrobiales bacterium]